MTTLQPSQRCTAPGHDCPSVDPAATHLPADASPRRQFLRRLLPAAPAVSTAGAAALLHDLAPHARADDAPADIDPGAVIVKLLRRTSYGVTPDSLAYASALGFDAYLEEQLNPDSLTDAAFDEQFARLVPTPQIQNFSFAELYQRNREYLCRLELLDTTLLRAIYSRKQLYARMVEFWHDHFNLDSNVLYGGYFQAIKDRDVIRPYALGNFGDLLVSAATNSGMLTYLTNVTNTWELPNENFARELMELHTLGVNGGYTQNDVINVSRAFTGWSMQRANDPVNGGAFWFNELYHDYDEKRVLGHDFPAGRGIEDGLEVLQIVAEHPATATHIARKLCKWFLEENPRESVVQYAALRFRQTRGDIKAVLRAILTPANLYAAAPKLKRPFHLVVSGARAVQPTIADPWFLRAATKECGHPVFEWGPPNGFPDTIQYWGGAQMARWNYGCTLGENAILGLQSDASRFYEGITDPMLVLDEMNRRFLQNEMNMTDREEILNFLMINPQNARHRRATTGLLLAMQGFQWY